MGKQRVWVDGCAFENENQYGVWRVFYEIMSRTAVDIDYTLWLRALPKRPLPSGVRIYQDNGRSEVSRYNLTQRLRRRLATRRDPPGLRETDLFHSSGFTFPMNKRIRSIITVYDMIAESHFPMCIRELRESIPIKLRALERATLLPCISQSTANELHAFYPQFQSKTTVIPLGAEHLLQPEDSSVSVAFSEKASALYVGQRMGYKNFYSVLAAMLDPHWPNDTRLDIVGSPWLQEETLLLKKLELTNRVCHLGQVSDRELSQLYRSARCLIFPSFQEGFGLPCLEAQSNRCPLLCSDIPVFRDVAGEGAMYFDPRIAESIAAAVSRLGDLQLRSDFVQRGFENLGRFSWNKAASRMIEVYEQARHA